MKDDVDDIRNMEWIKRKDEGNETEILHKDQYLFIVD